MSGLACGHRFCASCWCEYLTTKVMEQGAGPSISCAAHGCDILVDDETVLRLVSEPLVLRRYQHLITDSFVQVGRGGRRVSPPARMGRLVGWQLSNAPGGPSGWDQRLSKMHDRVRHELMPNTADAKARRAGFIMAYGMQTCFMFM